MFDGFSSAFEKERAAPSSVCQDLEEANRELLQLYWLHLERK